MKKAVTLFLTLILAVSMLSACSSFSDYKDPSSDYGPYVQCLLDVSYKNDATKYLELVDDTQDAADGYYQSNMEYWAYELADYYKIVFTEDAVEERMIELMKPLFAKVKYEVADAVKVEDYHTVQVTIYPLSITGTVDDEVSAFIDDFNARTDAGEYGDIENDEAAYYAWEAVYANAVMDIIESHLDDMSYGDPVEKIVKVTTDEDGYYGISDADQMDLESYLVQ